MDLKKIGTKEIIRLYSESIRELKERKVIRTKNVLGELGEYLAINFYNSHLGLPKLQTAPVGTQNVDATSRNGERYSIKSCTTKTTGVFYGLEPKGSANPDKQSFEYVIICVFDDNYELLQILELPWSKFLIHKNWHSRMSAWNLTLNKQMCADCRIIYQK